MCERERSMRERKIEEVFALLGPFTRRSKPRRSKLYSSEC